ncbi:uncharacterized protein LOC135825989 [Sycon ciliatum]|uniref:uncharacterized protein LOC135825989 n=1 Tax=Sycon ciliatum TaxID=27933 RepID=UPI0031F67F5C
MSDQATQDGESSTVSGRSASEHEEHLAEPSLDVHRHVLRSTKLSGQRGEKRVLVHSDAESMSHSPGTRLHSCSGEEHADPMGNVDVHKPLKPELAEGVLDIDQYELANNLVDSGMSFEDFDPSYGRYEVKWRSPEQQCSCH